MRCIALAQELTRVPGTKVEFLTRTADFRAIDIIIKYGFKVIPIDDSVKKELDFIIYCLKEDTNKDKVVIVDSYSINEAYLVRLNQYAFVMAIDDMNRHPFPVDILLNQNVFFDKFDYVTRADTIQLLGGNYILLRDEIIQSSKRERNKKQVSDNILITMGGSDPTNQTYRIVELIAADGDTRLSHIKVNVVIGPSFEPSAVCSIKKIAQENPQIVIHENVTNLSELMAVSDAAISSSGSSCYELIALKVPSLVILTEDNQELVYKALKEKKCANTLGVYYKLTDFQIKKAIADILTDEELRLSLIENCTDVINIEGKKKVVSTLLGLFDRET